MGKYPPNVDAENKNNILESISDKFISNQASIVE